MMRAGDGLRALLKSEPDLDEALHTVCRSACVNETRTRRLQIDRETDNVGDVIEQIEKLASVPITKP